MKARKSALLSAGHDQSQRISSLCLYWREGEEHWKRKLEKLMSMKAPCSSFLFFSFSSWICSRLEAPWLPEPPTHRLEALYRVSFGVCSMNFGGSVGRILASGPGSNISEKSSITFSKFLLFSKHTASRVTSFLCKSVFAGDKPGRRWDFSNPQDDLKLGILCFCWNSK